jgi:hypothetical protein
MGFGKCDSGFAYSCTLNGFDADGAAGMDDASCAHPAGTMRAAITIAAAGFIARNTLQAELERCIRIISINQA